MTVKNVDLKDIANEMGKFSEERIEEYKQATVIGVARSIPELVKKSPVDTGRYASSWDMTVGERNVLLGNYAPHAPIIEYGTQPFTPPIGPLLAWAKRVLQDPSQPPGYSPEVWSLAIGTQKKIEREGMKPRHIMEKNLPMIIENIKREFTRIV